jgi:2-epi-5-epi-valiolone synthase
MSRTSAIGTWIVETHLPIYFEIKKSQAIFSKQNKDILEFGSSGPGARRIVVIDRKICQFYLNDVVAYFETNGVEIHVIAIDADELNKNIESLQIILKEMDNFGLLRRDEPLIAIGGGVLLDIAGMAAALYRRGVPYIRVPTTLVGIIDASVGAKTGINFEARRNRLGGYYPPIASYLDKSFLKTLDTVEISSGLGEVLKMAVIKDKKLFNILESHGRALVATKFEGCEYADEVINSAVEGMKVELEHNLFEKDLKRIVDFGHSFSPVIEMRSIDHKCYTPLTHGQAVTIDVIFSSVISTLRGYLSYCDLVRITKAARNMSIPTDHELFREPLILLEALNDTVRHRNGDQNLPIPVEIGKSMFLNDVNLSEIKAAVVAFTKLNQELNGEGN